MTNGTGANNGGVPLIPVVWNVPKDETGTPAPYMKKTPLGKQAMPNVIDDPVQGCGLSNCFLIASISAFSWMNPGKFSPGKDALSPPQNFEMYVLDSNQNLVLPTPDPKNPGVLANNELPLSKPDSLLVCGAQLTAPLNGNFPPNESWVAFYEKAYAISQMIPASPVCSGNGNPTHYSKYGPYNPDIWQLNAGNPLYALMTLSQKNFAFSDTVNNPPHTSAYYTQTWTSNGITYPGLEDGNNWATNFTQNAGYPLFTKWGKTIYPTVAWTFLSDSDNSSVGRPSPQHAIKYKSSWLAANHAYAVLGKLNLEDPKNPGTFSDYVILRNPFGPSWSGKPSLPVGNTDAVYQPTNSYLWQWQDDATQLYMLNIGQGSEDKTKRTKPDGIFALRKQEFLMYFEAVGWVGQW